MQPAFWRKERESEGGRERERERCTSKPEQHCWVQTTVQLADQSQHPDELGGGREGEREESPLSPVTLTYQSFAGNSHCSGSPKTSLESEREGVKESGREGGREGK